MSAENAWLLDIGKPLRAAIGLRELLQIIDAPAIFDVPLTPAHSRQVIFWQKRMIPVMDLSIRMGAKATESKMLALVGFHDQTGQPAGIGAIALSAPPLKIKVNDADAAGLDEHTANWRDFVNAAFVRDGTVVPVLHLGSLFGR